MDEQRGPERMLVVAHGTASDTGSATTAELVRAIGAARPSTSVDLCFLDVARPRLPEVLDTRPTVLVPLLLSTGFHVQTDIPAAVAAYPHVRVARHLGPHPLLVDALTDRLPARSAATTVLAGSGSSRPGATAELDETAALLARRLATPVTVVTLGADLAQQLAALTPPVLVATYLLADGRFVARLRAALAGRGTVSPPLGVHPALVELVWHRYDEAVAVTR